MIAVGMKENKTKEKRSSHLDFCLFCSLRRPLPFVLIVLDDRVLSLRAIPASGAIRSTLRHGRLLRIDFLFGHLPYALLSVAEPLEELLVAFFHVRQRLVELLDPLIELQLDKHVAGTLVQTLLDQHPPPVVAPVILILGVVLLDEKPCHVCISGGTVFEWYSTEQERLQDMSKLRGSDLVLGTDLMQSLCGNERGSRHQTRTFLACICRIRVGVDIQIPFEEFRAEDMIISRVTKLVKGFVRVLHSQFYNSRILDTDLVNSGVELGTMARAMVMGKDKELRYSEPGR